MLNGKGEGTKRPKEKTGMPQNQNQQKKPSREELIEAAQNALTKGDPNSLAEAAELFADAAALGMEGRVTQPPGYRVRGTRDWDRPPNGNGNGNGRNGGRSQTPSGPGAEKTGHGMARGGGPRNVEGPAAYEAFIDELRPALERAGDAVEFTERRGWVKIVSRVNGHKIYIAKSKTAVSRIESTIEPSVIEGAASPDRKNGRIASWLPADPEAVSKAIEYLASSSDQVRAPERGGDDTAEPQEPPAVGRTSTRSMRSWSPGKNGNG